MSSTEPMPGGTGAGTPLGLLLFLVLFNGAGPQASQLSIGEQVTVPRRQRKPMDKGKVKWVDDGSLMASLDMASSLVPDTRPELQRPVPYRGRFELRLPREKNTLQDEIDSLNQYAIDHPMSINHQKTKVLLFSRHRKYDFIPEIQLIPNENIEVVEEMKIVGFILRSDMKTCSNTEYIVKKAYARMWIVRRLKMLGASRQRLVDVLQKQVLSVLLLAVPAWDCLLTVQERTNIERLLRTGLRIIWGEDFVSVDQVLKDSKLKTMQEARTKIVRRFVKKSIHHKKFKNWFCPQPETQIQTRSLKNQFKPVYSRTATFAKSAIPILTSIANSLP